MTEKKLKIASENIRMSDELKERIMKKCETNAEHISSDGYTDHVYQVETVKPRKWLKVISGIAACAVIAGGVGAGVVYMSRQGAPSAELDDVETTQEVSDTVEETSPKRLVIDDIMDYKYNELRDKEYWGDEYLSVLDDFLKNSELPERECPLDFNKTHFVFSDKKCELQVLVPDTLLFIDENDDVTCYSADTDTLIEQFLEVRNKKGVNAFSEFVNDENVDMYYYYDLRNQFDPDIILNGAEDEVGFSDAYEFNDAMQYALLEYMSRQTYIDPPNKQITDSFIEIKNADNIHVASVSIFNEDCMSFEILENGESTQQYWMTCDVTELMNILENAMNTEEKHDTDNAAYYFPGGNFVKMGNADYECELVGKGTLTDEQSAQVQDIFYGYDWAAHEVTDTSDLGLVSVFSFKWDNIDGAERHVIVCENGYIYYFDRRGTDYNEHIYKFDNTEIEDKIREMFGF